MQQIAESKTSQKAAEEAARRLALNAKQQEEMLPRMRELARRTYVFLIFIIYFFLVLTNN
jgi:hypothetical protein